MTTLPTIVTSTMFKLEKDVKSFNDEELTTMPTLVASTTLELEEDEVREQVIVSV